MKVLSIQVGVPQEISYRGQNIRTAIFKETVEGPVFLSKLGLHGDAQADLKVHGGPNKALYVYGFDAYAWWNENRPQDHYPNGSFGENLTVESLPEDQILIDDVYALGQAVVQVSEARQPCYKLAAKFNDPAMIKVFLQSQRPGIYFRVIQEGLIDVGDTLELLQRSTENRSIKDVFLRRVAKK